MQMKSSRYAEEEKSSAYATLRSRVKPAKHSKREVLASIREGMGAVSRKTDLLRFRLATTHTETWNQIPNEFSARNVVLDLNYHESAALVDAHVKKCKLRTEAESARAEAVAQRTSFAELEESTSRLISELEELMTCSYQTVYNFDQAKRVSSSYKLKVKLGDRYLSRRGALLQRVPLHER